MDEKLKEKIERSKQALKQQDQVEVKSVEPKSEIVIVQCFDEDELFDYLYGPVEE